MNSDHWSNPILDGLHIHPRAVVLVRSEDEILLVGLPQEIDVLIALDPAELLDLPLHLDVVRGAVVYLWMAHQDAVEEGVEAEVVLEHWVLEFLYVLLEVVLHAVAVEHGRVLAHLVHDLDDDVEGLGDGVGVEADLELVVAVLLGVLQDVVEDFSHHLADYLEGDLQVVVVPEQPHHDLPEVHVLVAVDLLSVVIGHEGAAHAPDLELEGVLDERSPDQIVVLPLEALEVALH